jgi:hypothetical protein
LLISLNMVKMLRTILLRCHLSLWSFRTKRLWIFKQREHVLRGQKENLCVGARAVAAAGEKPTELPTL